MDLEIIKESSSKRNQLNDPCIAPEKRAELKQRLADIKAELQKKADEIAAKDSDELTFEELQLRYAMDNELPWLKSLDLPEPSAAPKPQPMQDGAQPTGALTLPELHDGAPERAVDLYTKLKDLYRQYNNFPVKPDDFTEALEWKSKLDDLMVEIAYSELWFLFELTGGMDNFEQSFQDRFNYTLNRKLTPYFEKLKEELGIRDEAEVRLAETRDEVATVQRTRVEANNWTVKGLTQGGGEPKEGMLRTLGAAIDRIANDASGRARDARAIMADMMTTTLNRALEHFQQLSGYGRERYQGRFPEHGLPTKNLTARVKARLVQSLINSFLRDTPAIRAGVESLREFEFPLQKNRLGFPAEGLLRDQSSRPRTSSPLLLGFGFVFVVIAIVLGLFFDFGDEQLGAGGASQIQFVMADAFGDDGLRVIPAPGVELTITERDSGDTVAVAISPANFEGVMLSLNVGHYIATLDIGDFLPALPPSCEQGYFREFDVETGQDLKLSAVVYSANSSDSGTSIAPLTSDCINIQELP